MCFGEGRHRMRGWRYADAIQKNVELIVVADEVEAVIEG
jgi:hypothetical protein